MADRGQCKCKLLSVTNLCALALPAVSIHIDQRQILCFQVGKAANKNIRIQYFNILENTEFFDKKRLICLDEFVQLGNSLELVCLQNF